VTQFNDRSYTPITSQQIRQWQDMGLLPDPIPEYDFSSFETWPLWMSGAIVAFIIYLILKG